MCLQEDLRRAGIDPSHLTRVADRTMADNVAALRRGEVDVVQVFEPFAATLIAEGAGHVWYAQASRGPTSYTTFYARRGLLDARRDELHRMVRAIYRTQNWVARCDGDAIADAIARYFQDVPAAVLARCLRTIQVDSASGAAIRVCRARATIGCARAWCRADSCRRARIMM